MLLKINRDVFQNIENAFSRLRGNDSDAAALRQISDGLHAITDKTVNVSTIKPENKNQDCCFMSVYPDESTVTKIITAVVGQEADNAIAMMWQSSDAWTVEIDTRILTMGFTDVELTAMLLHEVGHIMASSSIPERISRVMKYEIAKSGSNRAVLKDAFFSKFLYFPILNACQGFDVSKRAINSEKKADSFAINAGYGEALDSAMGKLITKFGKGQRISPDDQFRTMMKFSEESLKDIETRKHTIVRKNVAKMITSTPSRVCRNLLGKVQSGISVRESGGSITESARDEYLTNRIITLKNQYFDGLVVTESIFNRIHKMPRIDPADIDYIGLETDNIRSNDDKMMIVSYIYNKLDIIDYYIGLIDSKNPKYLIPHTREDLIRMKETLNKYRIAVLNKALPTVNYGINIAYPEGYEG